ncbi:MAG TPA: hypothetical protein VJJ78_03005 [Candidatus Saccharimonadales bacterium]|nr:hypothetical protein [Candidatus Saccharimonadales bacterium]
MPLTYRPTPGEIDQALSAIDLIDVETQTLFELQHHYYSSNWNDPAPPEGEIFNGHATSTYPYSIGDLAVFGDLAGQIEGRWWGFPAYGLRSGLHEPPTDRRVYETESTIRPSETQSNVTVFEAGIGYTALIHDRPVDAYKLTLRREGELDNLDWTVRLYDVHDTKSSLLEVKEAPDEETLKRFMQIFRVIAWHSVSEPA